MQHKKYEYIDFIRGCAIILVFINHIPRLGDVTFENLNFYQIKFFAFGTYGVQLFYIISSFTLLISFYKRNENSYLNFYIRRFFRVAPIFYLGIIIHNLYFNEFLSELNFKNIFLNITFMNNIIPPSNDLIAGGSTIATEMNFYFILPFLFIYIRSYKKSIIAIVGALIIIFFINTLFENFFIDLSIGEPNFYRTIFVQIFVFLLGFVVFFINSKLILKNKPMNTTYKKKFFIKIIPLFILAFLIFIYGKQDIEFFYFRNMFFVSIFLSLFVNFIIIFEKMINKNFIFLIIKKIGTVSFSMYVWHWIIQAFVWNNFFFMQSDYSGKIIIFIFVSLLFTYYISLASYQLEKFFITAGSNLISKLNKSKR